MPQNGQYDPSLTRKLNTLGKWLRFLVALGKQNRFG